MRISHNYMLKNKQTGRVISDIRGTRSAMRMLNKTLGTVLNAKDSLQVVKVNQRFEIVGR